MGVVWVGFPSGGHHTVVCCDGEVFTCGRKEYGRLGLGKDTEEPNLPTQVEGESGNRSGGWGAFVCRHAPFPALWH